MLDRTEIGYCCGTLHLLNFPYNDYDQSILSLEEDIKDYIKSVRDNYTRGNILISAIITGEQKRYVGKTLKKFRFSINKKWQNANSGNTLYLYTRLCNCNKK